MVPPRGMAGNLGFKVVKKADEGTREGKEEGTRKTKAQGGLRDGEVVGGSEGKDANKQGHGTGMGVKDKVEDAGSAEKVERKEEVSGRTGTGVAEEIETVTGVQCREHEAQDGEKIEAPEESEELKHTYAAGEAQDRDIQDHVPAAATREDGKTKPPRRSTRRLPPKAPSGGSTSQPAKPSGTKRGRPAKATNGRKKRANVEGMQEGKDMEEMEESVTVTRAGSEAVKPNGDPAATDTKLPEMASQVEVMSRRGKGAGRRRGRPPGSAKQNGKRNAGARGGAQVEVSPVETHATESNPVISGPQTPSPPSEEVPRSPSLSPLTDLGDELSTAKEDSKSKARTRKRRQKKNPDGKVDSKRQKLTKNPLGSTPFPNHPHPTPEEVQTVVGLLSSVHGVHARPPEVPKPNLLVTGCGEVPSILDALIRTLLSASTTAANSNRAFKGLVDKFGVCGKRGSVNWRKVKDATTAEVYDAIKAGGLANVKTARIKDILNIVWEQNQERKKELQRMKEEEESVKKVEGNTAPKNGGVATSDSVANEPIKHEGGMVIKQKYHGHETILTKEVAYDDHTAEESEDELSLDHLHNLPDTEAMAKLTSFPGIGFKTASCVMLFCMGRQSFAVDTHVFRIARFLNWVPPEKANRETAFWHLDAKVPAEHKYALHQLFIKHGRECYWCKASGPLTYKEGVKAAQEKMEKQEKVNVKKEKKGKKGKGRKVKKEDDDETDVDEEVQGGEENNNIDIASRAEGDKVRVKMEAEDADGDIRLEDAAGRAAEVEEGRKLLELKMCPLEHLVKRFHKTSKGRGVKWEKGMEEGEKQGTEEEKEGKGETKEEEVNGEEVKEE